MYRNYDVCTDALRKIGVVAQSVTATAEEMKTAEGALYRMLSAWQNRGYSLWLVTKASITLGTATAYTMSEPRPVDVHTITLSRNGIETPMNRLTREEYDTLPSKQSTGLPTNFYFDRQRDAGVINVWPRLAVAGGETLEITFVRPTSTVVTDEQVDVPPEWYDAVVYGLAARLADDFLESDTGMVAARAEQELQLALAQDRDGSVYFMETD